MVDDDTKSTTKAPAKAYGKQGFRHKDGAKGSPTSVASLNSDTAVPLLRMGVSNNFDNFRKKISIACLEKYKNLGRLIQDETYYVPPAIDPKTYDLANDPHEIEKTRGL